MLGVGQIAHRFILGAADALLPEANLKKQTAARVPHVGFRLAA
jgi:hypothetical protein